MQEKPSSASRAGNVLASKYRLIKLLLREHAANGELVERFLREARAANIVRHPHVVDVLDIGEDAGAGPFLVQEFLEGEDLQDHLARVGGRLTLEEIRELLLPVIDAVALAHSRGVVHRDLKPGNIFLSHAGGRIVPKLLDFGISHAARGAGDARLTAAGMLLGSPAYMSPEQIQSSVVDARIDVWALGVILYEVVSGRLPFEDDSPGAIFVRIATVDAEPLERVAPSAPTDLTRIVARCLCRDPEQRYPSAAELLRELSNVCDGTAIAATRAGPVPVLRSDTPESAQIAPLGVGAERAAPTGPGRSLASPPRGAEQPTLRASAPLPEVPDLMLGGRFDSPPAPDQQVSGSPASEPVAEPPEAPIELDLGAGRSSPVGPSAPELASHRPGRMLVRRPDPQTPARGPVASVLRLVGFVVIALAVSAPLVVVVQVPHGYVPALWRSPLCSGGAPLASGLLALLTTALGASIGLDASRRANRSFGLLLSACGLLTAGLAMAVHALRQWAALDAATARLASRALPWTVISILGGFGLFGLERAWRCWKSDAIGERLLGVVHVALATFVLILAGAVAKGV